MLIQDSPFFWGTLILFGLTILFYIVCVSLIYYWHEKRATYVVLPLLYTFEFFVIGFFILSLICLIVQYFPEIVAITK